MNPETFVGVDLIDCNAKSPRPVDVAILRPTGDGAGVIRFEQFRFTHPTDSAWPMNVVSAVEKFQNGRTVFVVDGPQALAQPPNKTRVVERLLRTPAHTPSEVPLPRSRPFAGYIRTSIDFFNALVLQGFHLADLDGVGQEQVNLIETYPGAAWPRLHSGPSPLRSKSTIEGRKQRTAILEGIGCRFENSKLATHDELDAALCAALGWRWFVPTDGLKVALTGDVQAYRDDFRILREGRMLMPVTSRIVERSPSVVSKREAKAPELANDAALPQCDWVYFANTSGTEQTITLELAENSGVIARTAYNEAA